MPLTCFWLSAFEPGLDQVWAQKQNALFWLVIEMGKQSKHMDEALSLLSTGERRKELQRRYDRVRHSPGWLMLFIERVHVGIPSLKSLIIQLVKTVRLLTVARLIWVFSSSRHIVTSDAQEGRKRNSCGRRRERSNQGMLSCSERCTRRSFNET